MKLIAIVGMTGAGKSELAKLFEAKGYKKIRFGDITEELIRKSGADVNEENERKVRESLRKQYGMEAYAKVNLPKIEEALKTSRVAIDGLYSWEEYVLLKERFRENLLVLSVFSSPDIRYERLIDRELRPLTKEQARERDKSEIEKLNKAAPIVMSNYNINNVGTLYDLKQKFEDFIEWVSEGEENK